MDLHTGVIARRPLIVKVIQRRGVPSERSQPARVAVIVRPEFNVARSKRSIGNATDVAHHVHVGNDLLEDRPGIPRRNADFLRIRRKGIHGDPGILQIAVALLQFQIIGHAFKRRNLGAVVHSVSHHVILVIGLHGGQIQGVDQLISARLGNIVRITARSNSKKGRLRCRRNRHSPRLFVHVCRCDRIELAFGSRRCLQRHGAQSGIN